MMIEFRPLGGGWALVSTNDMLLKCRTNDDIYSSVGVGGLCVGTRQALLQGWLLCVGIVCLANVPDLVRWVVSAKSC
jgi:hypothetical protein